MSYQGLWDTFPEVRSFWTENRKILDDFATFLKEKAELDRYYGKGLERLGKLPIFDRPLNSLSPSFKGLQDFCTETSEQILYHANYLQNDLFNQLKKTILLQDATIHEHKRFGKRIVLEREKLVKNHIKCRDKFWKICRENENIGSKNNPKSAQTEENYHKAYMVAINQLNSFNPVFQEGIKKVLNEYQLQNTEKLKELRQVFQKFVSGEASNIYSMKMHVDILPAAIDTFNPEIEQRLFVDSVFTGRLVEDECFLSYSNGIPEKSMADVQFDENFTKVINDCWAGKGLTPAGKSYFIEEIQKNKGKKKFIMMLNEKRKNGEFKIPAQTFEDLGTLFNSALDSFDNMEHLSVAKQCIILSQTFFSYLGDSEEKTYLQSLIFDHPLWKKEEYWEFLMDSAISVSLESLTEFGDDSDTKEDLEMRKKSVISSAIISYAHIMTTFKIDKGQIVSLLEKSKSKHQLSDEELPILYLVDLDN